AVSCSRTMCAFTLSPNPATDAVTLQLTETDEVSGSSVLSTDRPPYEIQLWSGMRMLKSFKTDQPTFSIPMAGLPEGPYFVRVVKDGQTYTQKLIKK
ncbi:T9SS type A sorting domain-containing protein, partial [Tannerella forsythia]